MKDTLPELHETHSKLARQRVSSHTLRLKRITNFVSLAASIAVIGGIPFACIQIRQVRESDRCRIAISAIEPTRSPQFLDAYQRLQDLFADNDSTASSSEVMRNRAYYVLNGYDNIAILCLRGLADEQLVKDSTYRSMKQLVPILDLMKIPAENRTNIDVFLKRYSH